MVCVGEGAYWDGFDEHGHVFVFVVLHWSGNGVGILATCFAEYNKRKA